MTQYINLLAPDLLPKRDWASARNLAIGAGFALLVMTGFSAWFQVRAAQATDEVRATEARLMDVQQRLGTAAKEAAERKPNLQLAEEVKQAEALLRLRQELVQVVETGGIGRGDGFAEIMRAFARQTSDGLWLTGFSVSGSGEMEIQGRVVAPELLPAYIRRLNGEKAFEGRRFAALTMKGEEAGAQAEAGARTPGPVERALPPAIAFRLSSRESDAKAGERP